MKRMTLDRRFDDCDIDGGGKRVVQQNMTLTA
jgi:hypothetical protein